jgi:hypothetical protein
MKKSPMIGGKNDVTRLFFLGRLSCIHEMEHDCLREKFPKKCTCLFEPDLKRLVLSHDIRFQTRRCSISTQSSRHGHGSCQLDDRHLHHNDRN